MNTISTPKRTFRLLSFTVTKWQPAVHYSLLLIIYFLIGTTRCSFHEAAAQQYVWMNPCDGFYSQPSVGHSVHELHTKMCEFGYDKKFPINGVRYPDGRIVFFDNRRPLAASMAKVQVYVRVHDCDALAPKTVRNNPMLRKPIVLCDGTTIAPPDEMTWGDAIRMRSIGGARFNGGHIPEVPLYPPGRQQAPSIRPPCDTDGMPAAPIAPRLPAPTSSTSTPSRASLLTRCGGSGLMPALPLLPTAIESTCNYLGAPEEVGAGAGIAATGAVTAYEAYVLSGAASAGLSFTEWAVSTGMYASSTLAPAAPAAACVATAGLAYGAGRSVDYVTGNRISGYGATVGCAVYDTAAVIWRWKFDYGITGACWDGIGRGPTSFWGW
jgi:hypothetical protein